jgi:hypothetical protein
VTVGGYIEVDDLGDEQGFQNNRIHHAEGKEKPTVSILGKKPEHNAAGKRKG